MKTQTPDPATDGLVIKLSWQLQDRRSEVEILEHLRSKEITSVPQVVTSGELDRMESGLHGRIQGILGRDPNTDNRIYRAIVMKPFLISLTTIGEWPKFYEMFRGLIKSEFPTVNTDRYYISLLAQFTIKCMIKLTSSTLTSIQKTSW